MSAVSAAVAGVALGIGHSLESDHLAAISTLVDDGATGRSTLVGTSWGVGHSLPIVGVGLLFVLVGASLPERVALAAEVLSAALLVLLGVRTVLAAADRLSVETHAHDGGRHAHLGVGSVSLGGFHSHVDDESFVVGVVHGLAGSAAVVVGLVAAAPTTTASLSFLGGFVAATVLTMAAVSLLWGSVLDTTVRAHLEVLAGGLTVAIGVDVLLAVTTGAGYLPV
ncbi:MAG: high-affinity nickel-transporter protein [Halorientalis sp.]